MEESKNNIFKLKNAIFIKKKFTLNWIIGVFIFIIINHNVK